VGLALEESKMSAPVYSEEQMEQVRSSIRLAANSIKEDPRYKQLCVTLNQDLALSKQRKNVTEKTEIPNNSASADAMKELTLKANRLAVSQGKPEHFIMSREEICQAKADGAQADAERRLASLQELQKQTQIAMDVLYETTAGIATLLIKFGDDSRSYLNDVRNTRLAAVAELHSVKSSVEDLRKCFGSAEHTEEIKRMREFVEVSERIQKLQDNGFLDAVVEVMLKMQKT